MSRNIVRSSAGPFGSVRIEIRPGASYSLAVWINGQPQMPIHGLDASEAFDYAEDLLSTRTNELIEQYERHLSLESVTEIAQHYGVEGASVIHGVWINVNNMALLDNFQRRGRAHQILEKLEVKPCNVTEYLQEQAWHEAMDDTMPKDKARQRLALIRSQLAARI